MKEEITFGRREERLDILLAYLTDALDKKTRALVERRLKTVPAWQRDLEEARAALKALHSWKAPEPPEGLAQRTNKRLEKVMSRKESLRALRKRRAAYARVLVRVAMGAAVMLLALGLFAIYFSTASMDAHETVLVMRGVWRAGSKAAVRMVVRHGRSLEPIAGATARLTLRAGGRIFELAETTTDEAGAIESTFTVPELEPGSYYLCIETESGAGSDSFRRHVRVERPYAVMLTTDKPLYRPDAKEHERLVHIRALALSRSNLKPYAGAPVTIEIKDPEGNRIFRHEGSTSEYGLAWCDYRYPEEAALGRYHILAKVGDVASEKVFRMSRYVLPKFDLALETDKPWYRPGEMMKLTANLRYFFGEPVRSAKLTLKTDPKLKLPPYQFEETEDGKYVTALKLPDVLAGTELDRGDAAITLRLSAEDTAGQLVEKSLRRIVAKAPVRIGLVPESGTLVNSIENQIYLVLSTPDGAPYPGEFEVADESGRTIASGTADRTGVAEFSLAAQNIPVNKDFVGLSVTVKVPDGDEIRKSFTLATAERDMDRSRGGAPVLLRTDRAMYAGGDSVKITALTAGRDDVLFLDLIHDSQTLLTKTVPMSRGKGELTLDLVPELFGTLQLNLYRLSEQGIWARDTKLIYVKQPGGLNIEARVKEDPYRPREKASIVFSVTDDQGRPAQAALSLSVVDEALLAIAEEHPGLAQVYFAVEREMLRPGIDIHGLTPPESLVMSGPGTVAELVEKASFATLDIAHDRQGGSTAGARRPVVLRTYPPKVPRLRRTMNRRLDALAGAAWLVVIAVFATFYAYLIATKRYLAVALIPVGFILFLGIVVVTAGAGARYVGLQKGGYYERQPSELPAIRIAREFAEPEYDAEVGGAYGQPTSALRSEYLRDFTAGLRAEPEPSPQGERPEAERMPVCRPEPVVREEFPETLFWLPQVITDENGQTDPVEITMADSITTWRMLVSAVAKSGKLGALEQPLTVFQPFFADLDLPVSLTQHDEITIPVVVHNHLGEEQQVTLDLKEAEGFEILDEKSKELALKAHEVSSTGFRIRVTGVDKISLEVAAEGKSASGKTFVDAIKKEVSVEPDGHKVEWSVSDRLLDTAVRTFTVPDWAISGSENLFVKIYPGTFSQVVEGIESMLRRPSGCFEQTSSSLHPNILVLDYLRETGRSSPEIEMKALSFIQAGYQKLLTFEVGQQSGSFSLYGKEPASVWLSAYALMEFADMSRVHDVDPGLLTRIRNYLASKQQDDGSFSMNGGRTAHGAGGGDLKVTAFCAWAMAREEQPQRGRCSRELLDALDYLEKHLYQKDKGGYLSALAACAAVESLGANHPFAQELLGHLQSTAVREDGAAVIPARGETLAWGRGDVADKEATALGAIAMLEAGGEAQFTEELLTSIVRGKDACGGWHSTQATVLSLKALALASRLPYIKGPVTIDISVGGEHVRTLTIAEAQRDVVHFVPLKGLVRKGENEVSLKLKGEGKPCYQLVGSYHVPWSRRPRPELPAPVTVDVNYDRTAVSRGGVVRVSATVKNVSSSVARMVMVDVGVPPGFTPDRSDLDALLKQQKINRYEITGRQVILYLSDFQPKERLTVSFRLRACFLVTAKAGVSSAWPYYEPQKTFVAEPLILTVK